MSDTTENIPPPQFKQAKANQRIMVFTGFGVLVRMLQLSIERRPIRSYPPGYLISAAAWGGIGYWWYKAEIHQKERLYSARGAIAASRAKERATLGLPADSTGTALPS